MKQFGFIKSEAGARASAAVTGGATVAPWIETLSPYLKFGSLVVGFLTAIATFGYYVPLAIEKWKHVLSKKK